MKVCKNSYTNIKVTKQRGQNIQLISLLACAMKLYIITLYQSLVLLLVNLGCVVILTQSLFITFLNVS